MANHWLNYAKIFGQRLYRPLKPILRPLKHPLVLSLLITLLLALEISGRMWPVGNDYDALEKAAWHPWRTQINYRSKRAEIAAWEKRLEDRPYSKDILLKLALLYTQVNDAESAQNYFNQAQYLDPLISPLP